MAKYSSFQYSESSYGTGAAGETGQEYGTIYYSNILCEAAVYGVEIDVANDVSGNITDIQQWVGTINMTGNVYIKSGGAVVIDCDCYVISNDYVIVVEDGGYLNTRGKRLPRSSDIHGRLIIT